MGEDERCQQFWLGEPFGCTHWFCPVANFSLCWKTYITFSDCLGRSAHRWRFAQISIFVFENDWLLQKRRRCCILTTVMCSFSFAKPIRLSARQLDWKLSRAIRQTASKWANQLRADESVILPTSQSEKYDRLAHTSQLKAWLSSTLHVCVKHAAKSFNGSCTVNLSAARNARLLFSSCKTHKHTERCAVRASGCYRPGTHHRINLKWKVQRRGTMLLHAALHIVEKNKWVNMTTK